MPGPITGGLNLLVGKSTWAGIGLASAYPAGSQWLVTDIGSAGKIFKTNGTTRWYLSDDPTLYTLAAPVTGITNTPVIADQYLLKTNLLQVLDRLYVYVSMGKSGTTDTGTLTFKMGTAGTTGDTNIFSQVVLTAANRGYGQWFNFFLQDATTIVKKGPGSLTGSIAATNSAAVPAGITISSAITNSLWFSVVMSSSSTNDTVSLEDLVIQFGSKA